MKVQADNLIAADWGDSDALETGALVWAVGSPFGLRHSITFGIVSAKNRGDSAGSAYQDFLQTDAAVNPGNSGGPLVDSRGRVVGINTAIVGDTYQGISFAVPSLIAKQVYQRLKSDGHIARGWLGVAPQELTDELRSQVGLNDTQGVYVAAVINRPQLPSPAANAGGVHSILTS